MSKKEKKKGKKSKKKLIIFILVLLVAGGLTYYALCCTGSSTKKTGAKVVDKIDNFDYKVADTDTKLFKSEFKELKKVLSAKEVKREDYAASIAKLFIIDFFTLENKVTKNDVGGIQFVYSNYKTTFIDKARDEFYKYVKSNLNDDRAQALPVVKEITVESNEKVTASDVLSGDTFASIDEAYKVSLKWTYEEDLGYQTSATVIIIKDNDKLAVAKLTSN